ncbi:MAG TPA: methionine synthase [Bacteroidales bacterium]|jgi:5-methyltetrahydrofolate--homocysteine methyltransferase|nr:methionine synthase [Bacteroidales bacterium]
MGKTIYEIIQERVLVMDGAMGTMIQRYQLKEEDFRGELLKHHPFDLKGDNDILCLTQPDLIKEIHRRYLEVGADIIETNTFNANAISQADYKLEHLVYQMNYEAARLAIEVARQYSTPTKPRFVAGSIGPTNKTLSLSPDINNPANRAISFEQMEEAYVTQVEALLDGGVDILLIETIFDTLNAKAALLACKRVLQAKGKDIVMTARGLKRRFPIMVSGTISDASGRTLSGQTPEAFLISLSHAELLSIGFNCSMGALQLRPYIEEIASKAPFYISVYPNAGLPNQFGEYEQSPDEMAHDLAPLLHASKVNIIGGCCGTTPEHIRKLVEMVNLSQPHLPSPRHEALMLSGLDPLVQFPGSNFINIGERTNVSGSKKFARLIREERFEEALQVARQQVENGAQILDINMDDALLDSERCMKIFLHHLMSDPEIARIPLMIDSSKWSVIDTGLQCSQGKCIVNSISLKEGEKVFIQHARTILDYGAAVVVMAFDENGQADTFERRISICQRAFRLLTHKVGFHTSDIILDANVLAIATGMSEHNQYAVEFIRAVKWIKENLHGVRTSGGISNLSFSFRGNDKIRQAIHSVFLYHAIQAGLDMGIVNAGALPVYEEIPEPLLTLVEDVILNRRKDATSRLVMYANQYGKKAETDSLITHNWRSDSLEKRLEHALIKGISDFLEEDMKEALETYPSALQIIEGPLMEGMNLIGELFGSGKMFLPQVIRAARVMKKAVDFLTPYLEKEKETNGNNQTSAGKILLATVKGDVHDIGKNIVKVVLSCNNYEIIDLGVMVPAKTILETAIENKVDMIGLSGLITPSLEEMCLVAEEMEIRGMTQPLLIGGATTSELHTALRIAPKRSYPVIHVKDASLAVNVANQLINHSQQQKYWADIQLKYENLREKYQATKNVSQTYITINQARSNRLKMDWDKEPICQPAFIGTKYFHEYDLSEISPFIDWTFFFHAWRLTGKYPSLFDDPVKGEEANKLYADAQEMLYKIIQNKWLQANAAFFVLPANSLGDSIEVYHPDGRVWKILHFLRNQEKKPDGIPNLCLSDFIAPKESQRQDYLGAFAVTTGIGIETQLDRFDKNHDDYSGIMLKILANRLAEAFAELLHKRVRREFWAYAPDENLSMEDILKEKYQGIRPAPGYPACPDHSGKVTLFEMLDAEKQIGISLTSHYAMYPAASVCGYYFSHLQAKYFNVGKINPDQIQDYALRKQLSIREVEKLLRTHLNYEPLT